MHKDNFEAR
jgi:exoribonuclease II